MLLRLSTSFAGWLATLRRSWEEEARAEAALHPRFGRALASYATFHATYARWQRQGHLSPDDVAHPITPRDTHAR